MKFIMVVFFFFLIIGKILVDVGIYKLIGLKYEENYYINCGRLLDFWILYR